MLDVLLFLHLEKNYGKLQNIKAHKLLTTKNQIQMVAKDVKLRHVNLVSTLDPSEALRRHSTLHFIITINLIFLHHHLDYR